MATPNFYQKHLGPRWYVTAIVNDPVTGDPPPDIAKDDALRFDGVGNGAGDCKLVNITKNKTWGEACLHPHPDSRRPNRMNEIQMKRPSTTNFWIITFSKLPAPSDRYQIEAKFSSGGGSWTATEG